MKNNTKIRLHLSKQLFESLTKQVIAEAKVNGGGAYTEAVKQPKANKAHEKKRVHELETMTAEKKDKHLTNEIDPAVVAQGVNASNQTMAKVGDVIYNFIDKIVDITPYFNPASADDMVKLAGLVVSGTIVATVGGAFANLIRKNLPKKKNVPVKENDKPVGEEMVKAFKLAGEKLKQGLKPEEFAQLQGAAKKIVPQTGAETEISEGGIEAKVASILK